MLHVCVALALITSIRDEFQFSFHFLNCQGNKINDKCISAASSQLMTNNRSCALRMDKDQWVYWIWSWRHDRQHMYRQLECVVIYDETRIELKLGWGYLKAISDHLPPHLLLKYGSFHVASESEMLKIKVSISRSHTTITNELAKTDSS